MPGGIKYNQLLVIIRFNYPEHYPTRLSNTQNNCHAEWSITNMFNFNIS
jgi:hypothetical protein